MIELKVVPFHLELDFMRTNTRGSKWIDNHKRVKNPGVPMSGQTFLVEGQPRKVVSVSKWLSDTQTLKDTYVVRFKHVGQPQARHMQCKDLDAIGILKKFNVRDIITLYPFVSEGFPPKLIRAKLNKLHQQGLLRHWSHGYKLTDKGLALITK